MEVLEQIICLSFRQINRLSNHRFFRCTLFTTVQTLSKPRIPLESPDLELLVAVVDAEVEIVAVELVHVEKEVALVVDVAE